MIKTLEGDIKNLSGGMKTLVPLLIFFYKNGNIKGKNYYICFFLINFLHRTSFLTFFQRALVKWKKQPNDILSGKMLFIAFLDYFWKSIIILIPFLYIRFCFLIIKILYYYTHDNIKNKINVALI